MDHESRWWCFVKMADFHPVVLCCWGNSSIMGSNLMKMCRSSFSSAVWMLQHEIWRLFNASLYIPAGDSFEATFPADKACYFLARKSSIGGTRNFPWPWWSHGNFHRFCRGFPWPGLGEGCLFSTEKWCWSLKSGNICNAVLSWICHCERNRFVSHLQVFFGWKNLEDQSVGAVFSDNMKSRESQGFVRESSKKAGLTIQDFAEIWLLMVVVMMMFFAEPFSWNPSQG